MCTDFCPFCLMVAMSQKSSVPQAALMTNTILDRENVCLLIVTIASRIFRFTFIAASYEAGFLAFNLDNLAPNPITIVLGCLLSACQSRPGFAELQANCARTNASNAIGKQTL